MLRLLRSPRWLLGHVLVVAICVGFVNLGFWQVRRLEDRRLQNMVVANRLATPPVPIEELVAGAGSDIDSLEFRNATAVGTFDTSEEVLVRSQVHQGKAGWHVLTPLTLGDGSAVMVNRGWVPLDMDSVPVPARPPSGEVTVPGWVSLTRVRQMGGALEPEGRLAQIARVDLARLQQQMPFDLLPVYLISDPSGTALPIPPKRPDVSDEGPHLMYAVEWFSFALIGVVGYFFLIRRAVRRSVFVDGGGGPGQTVDDGDVANSVQ